jgi:hypothetical protein
VQPQTSQAALHFLHFLHLDRAPCEPQRFTKNLAGARAKLRRLRGIWLVPARSSVDYEASDRARAKPVIYEEFGWCPRNPRLSDPARTFSGAVPFVHFVHLGPEVWKRADSRGREGFSPRSVHFVHFVHLGPGARKRADSRGREGFFPRAVHFVHLVHLGPGARKRADSRGRRGSAPHQVNEVKEVKAGPRSPSRPPGPGSGALLRADFKIPRCFGVRGPRSSIGVALTPSKPQNPPMFWGRGPPILDRGRSHPA